MRLAAQSRSRIEAEARQQYREAVASAPEPEIRNAGAVEALEEVLSFEFHGMAFVAQPTPHKDAVALIRYQSRVKALDGRDDAQALAEYSELLADMIARFARLAHPVRLRDRIRFFGRNPFEAATEAEVSLLVGFFSACRMIARFRYGKPTSPVRRG
jgi:hypothetical protein